jgi:cysteine dioxygenase
MTVATSSQETQKLLTIAEFVHGLRELNEKDFATIERPLEYLRTHRVNPESLQPYLFWNSQHYTRNLVDKTQLYELVAICWEAGMKSSIHNHKGQNCWMAAPIGKLAVQNYRVISEDLGAQSCEIVLAHIEHITAENPVAVDPLNPVHDVRNPREWNERAVSLHVYSRPFDSCVVYSAEQGKCGEMGLQYTSMYGKSCG